MKVCGRCCTKKTAINFNIDRQSKDGLDHYCRSCNRERLQEWRNKAKNYIIEEKATISYIREILRTIIQDHKVTIPLEVRIPLAKALYQKLLDNPNCPYTGVKLIPRVNLSLDHIKPISRGGNHVIDNLEWVSRQANYAKSNMTPNEFYKFCTKVLFNWTTVRNKNCNSNTVKINRLSRSKVLKITTKAR